MAEQPPIHGAEAGIDASRFTAGKALPLALAVAAMRPR